MKPQLELLPKATPWFWWNGHKIGIVSDDPGGEKAIAEFPELEAKTLAQWKAEQFNG